MMLLYSNLTPKENNKIFGLKSTALVQCTNISASHPNLEHANAAAGYEANPNFWKIVSLFNWLSLIQAEKPKSKEILKSAKHVELKIKPPWDKNSLSSLLTQLKNKN